eukprot:m.40010 g.40010  ORF g.40010 m.40010 type:complete len:1184 (+) comp9617_c0_seq4:174-3725(+)
MGFEVIFIASLVVVVVAKPDENGLTLTRFSNTALAGKGDSTQVLPSLENITDCNENNCKRPSSLLVTGRLQPLHAGKYGFKLSFDPPLAYPSTSAYARLWVNDHLLYPNATNSNTKMAGIFAPLWMPLPPRPVTATGQVVDYADAANLSSYEVRLEYVCLAPSGCGHALTLRWANFETSTVKAYQTSPGRYHIGNISAINADTGTCGGTSKLPVKDMSCEATGILLNSPVIQTATVAECCAACRAHKSCAVAIWNGPLSEEHDSVCRLETAGVKCHNSTGKYMIRVRNDVDMKDKISSENPNTHTVESDVEYTPIPSSVLIPTQSTLEIERRGLRKRLLDGWGTFYFPSYFAWSLLPESFLVQLSLYRISNSHYLPNEGLVVSKPQLLPFPEFVIRAGLHSYNHSYMELSLTWFDKGEIFINISVEATVDYDDNSKLTVVVTNNSPMNQNLSDIVMLITPNFTDGRAGEISCRDNVLSGYSYGLRNTSVYVVNGNVLNNFTPQNESAPSKFVAVSLQNQGEAIVFSTDPQMNVKDATEKTQLYRSNELATLDKYGEWAEVKDAIQTVMMWSFMYDPREGYVAPEYQYSPGNGFATATPDGDTIENLFLWDGSFASYMLSLDALDLSFSNLIQIIKMRTAGGFLPGLHTGTFNTEDTTQPTVTGKVLYEIVKRYGIEKTRWVVELCFDDLYNWNTWLFTTRREAPLGIVSHGSTPYPWAPDNTNTWRQGGGDPGESESGQDNGPMYSNTPFNVTGLYLADAYAAGSTGLYLVDCLAQIGLAKAINRTEAVQELQSRYDIVSKAMLKTLWNESAGFFQNKYSKDLSVVPHMDPTSFYPLLAGPLAVSEDIAATNIQRHLTNRSRFSVWPNASTPTVHPPPPDETRPLVQWYTHKCDRGFPCPNSPHRLCCSNKCDLSEMFGNLVQTTHEKARIEGMGLARYPEEEVKGLIPLYEYNCTVPKGAPENIALSYNNWKPPYGGPCNRISNSPQMWIYPSQSVLGRVGDNLWELELWYKPGDFYAVSSPAGKLEALNQSYSKIASLGYVWPAPGSANATSRYGLPSVSRDDETYNDQDYWRGRIWTPMIQIVYWGLVKYNNSAAKGARKGLVTQSKSLLLKNWRGYTHNSGNYSEGYQGMGRYVFENYAGDTGQGYEYSSSATPMYSWGALAGFIGLQENGFYDPIKES